MMAIIALLKAIFGQMILYFDHNGYYQISGEFEEC